MGKGTRPAICPYARLGQIAAAQQQLSFWGIKTILQQKQDQLQSTPVPRSATSSVLSYAPTASAGDAVVASGKVKNPLASPLYDTAEAEAPPSPVWGTWVQGLGDAEHDGALSATDTTHSSSTYAVQAGLDRTQRNLLTADDALILGIVSSWTNTRTSFEGSTTKLHLTGPGIGLYSEYVRGGFSTDLTAKFDFLKLNEEFAGLAPDQDTKVLNSGVSGNVQYKIMGEHNAFLEPTAGFSLTHTGFANGAALGLEDAYTLRLQTGARVGTSWDLGHDISVDANLKALLYGNTIAQGTSFAGTGALVSVITPSDAGLARGELDPELCFNLPRDYSLSFSGQYRFGHDLSGGALQVNLRKQW